MDYRLIFPLVDTPRPPVIISVLYEQESAWAIVGDGSRRHRDDQERWKRNFRGKLTLLASARSVGKKLKFKA